MNYLPELLESEPAEKPTPRPSAHMCLFIFSNIGACATGCGKSLAACCRSLNPIALLLSLILLPWRLAEAREQVQAMDPETCVRIEVSGCAGANFAPSFNGPFVPYDGECGTMGGRQPWVWEDTGVFFFYIAANQDWVFGPTCGSSPTRSFGGITATFPFPLSAAPWTCQNPAGTAWASGTMTTSCVLYKGQHTECLQSTYNATGTGPEGRCHPCPASRPSSFPGATSEDECFTVDANLYVASGNGERVTVLSNQLQEHMMLKEGGELDYPEDIVFVNSTIMAVTNYVGNNVVLLDIKGNFVGVLATISHPWGIMFIKEKRRVVVARNTPNFRQIKFINVDKYDEQGTLSPEISEDMDSITVTATSGALRSVSQGETSNEVLYTTSHGKSERSERGGEEPQHRSPHPLVHPSQAKSAASAPSPSARSATLPSGTRSCSTEVAPGSRASPRS